jgi:IMP dehydrogenase
MNVKPGYTFDDLLLVPKYSTITSRKDVNLSVDLGKGIKLNIPFVSANMQSITGAKMATTISQLGGLGLLHRFFNLDDYHKNHEMIQKEFNDIKNNSLVGCSVGIKSEDKILVDTLVNEYGCKIICVDVAHGDHINCNEMVSWIAKKYPEVLIIGGNVANKYGALRLYDSGANVIKAGVGGGSLCTTRIETGNGAPQMTALENVYEASKDPNWQVTGKRKFKIIADGGIRRSGDIVKALCFADTVMIGNLFAGTDETPGKSFGGYGIEGGSKYKYYAGSSTHKTNHVEGVVAQVVCKGPVTPIIEKLIEGLRSGCSYQGVSNLDELKEDPVFYTITNAGLRESHPHALESKE